MFTPKNDFKSRFLTQKWPYFYEFLESHLSFFRNTNTMTEQKYTPIIKRRTAPPLLNSPKFQSTPIQNSRRTNNYPDTQNNNQQAPAPSFYSRNIFDKPPITSMPFKRFVTAVFFGMIAAVVIVYKLVRKKSCAYD